MRISKLRIENYKSFRLSDEIVLTDGFNVIVGQNNTGKTALAEALSLGFSDNPHRSLKTLPNRGTLINDISRVDFSFQLDQDELFDLLKTALPRFYVPIPSSLDAQNAERVFLEAISGQIILDCSFRRGQFVSAHLPRYGNVSSTQVMGFEFKPSDVRPKATGAYSGRYEAFGVQLAGILKERIYSFKSERFHLAENQMGASSTLVSDASNLPAVLHLLQSSNPSRFKRLNEYIGIVFPEIKQITVPPISTDRARILVWTVDAKTERDDLAMSLSQSGTGIGQVLAMLYVVVTSEYPRTIIIDEPQSFLHPGAIRKLFDIFKQHSQHQYIITTHSPTVVTAADPQTLLLLRKKEAESTIEKVNIAETVQLRQYLSEIGARLSDVFGADNILWVEGSTEEQCFPLIMSRIAKQPLFGTTILGVMQTGDFEGRHSKKVFEVYTRLSQGKGLLPPAVGFIFDREGRSDDDCDDLKHRSNGTIHFLERRMFENYLLNPNGIAAVVSGIAGFRDKQIEAAEVVDWLNRNRWNRKYFDRTFSEQEQTTETWIRMVHGARILEDMFKELSENRVNYDDKVEYGVALTNWIIENAPKELEELALLITDSIAKGNETKAATG